MIKSLRNVELAFGTKEKIPTPSESKNLNVVRKSIVAKEVIKKGDYLSSKNLTVKRPGDGISPIHWDKLIGLKSPKFFDIDDKIDISFK